MAADRIGFQQSGLHSLAGQEVGGEAADYAASHDYYITVIIGQLDRLLGQRIELRGRN